jgi:hypothetical protein
MKEQKESTPPSARHFAFSVGQLLNAYRTFVRRHLHGSMLYYRITMLHVGFDTITVARV